MATVAFRSGAYPGAGKVHAYTVVGLVAGSNALVLPTPPAVGSFDPSGLETPTQVRFTPYNFGAAGAQLSFDPNSIANTNGAITLTAYSSGSTDAIMEVF